MTQMGRLIIQVLFYVSVMYCFLFLFGFHFYWIHALDFGIFCCFSSQDVAILLEPYSLAFPYIIIWSVIYKRHDWYFCCSSTGFDLLTHRKISWWNSTSECEKVTNAIIVVYCYYCLSVQLISTAVHMFVFCLLCTNLNMLMLYFIYTNSLQGINAEDLRTLKEKLQQEVVFFHAVLLFNLWVDQVFDSHPDERLLSGHSEFNMFPVVMRASVLHNDWWLWNSRLVVDTNQVMEILMQTMCSTGIWKSWNGYDLHSGYLS